MRTLVSLVVVAAGCGRVGFQPRTATGDALADGPPADAIQWAPFGSPVRHDVLNSGAREYGPTLSADGREMFFASHRAGPSYIMRTTRATTGDPFEMPTVVTELDSAMNDGDPGLARNGLEIYFDTQRSGANEIWVATRASLSASWDIPMRVDELVGFTTASFFGNDLRLVVSDASDLYEVTRASLTASWGTPRLIAELADPSFVDLYGAMSEDGLELFWESDRPPGGIFYAVRPRLDQPFGLAIKLPLGGVEMYATGDPELSTDGRTLVFVCVDPGGLGEFEVFTATRQPL